MNQVYTAALWLLASTALMALLGWYVWQRRHRPVVTAVPDNAIAPKSPLFSRKSRDIEPEIEMMPERLARISGRSLIPDDHMDGSSECSESDASEVEQSDTTPETIEAMDMRLSDAPALPVAAAVSVRLVPQIPIGDHGTARNWLGGRPRLAEGTDWPLIAGEPGDFLAQLACADLPAELWADAVPRDGWLALFVHPYSDDALIVHVPDLGAPIDPPHPVRARLGAHDIPADSDLMRFVRPAFPEWPIDLIAADNIAADNSDVETLVEATSDNAQPLLKAEYDIADPAFHPLDWDSMLAMVSILEARLSTLEMDDETTDTTEAAAINREACARAEEIIAIVRETAGTEEFSSVDAVAVMDALQAIHWTMPGMDTDETDVSTPVKTLPLTTHHPDADLWVQDYRRIHFDHSKHRYCADESGLSPATRALYEPLWQPMAAQQMVHIHADEGSEICVITLPTSGLMSWRFGDESNLALTIGKRALTEDDAIDVRAGLSI